VVGGAGVEKIEREDVNRPEDAAEEEPRHQQAEHAEGLRELAEAARCGLAHQQRDGGMAVERGQRNQVEEEQQQVEHEQNAEHDRQSLPDARPGGRDHLSEARDLRRGEVAQPYTCASGCQIKAYNTAYDPVYAWESTPLGLALLASLAFWLAAIAVYFYFF